jgi:hypothetical protein
MDADEERATRDAAARRNDDTDFLGKFDLGPH